MPGREAMIRLMVQSMRVDARDRTPVIQSEVAATYLSTLRHPTHAAWAVG